MDQPHQVVVSGGTAVGARGGGGTLTWAYYIIMLPFPMIHNQVFFHEPKKLEKIHQAELKTNHFFLVTERTFLLTQRRCPIRRRCHRSQVQLYRASHFRPPQPSSSPYHTRGCHNQLF